MNNAVMSRLRRVRAASIAALVGAVAGLLTFVVVGMTWAGREGTTHSLVVWFGYFAPGIVFGLAICLYLYFVHCLTTIRAAILFLCVIGAWHAAAKATIHFPRLVGLSDHLLWQIGLIYGTVNALCIAAAIALVLPLFRHLSVLLMTTLVGAVLGLPFEMWSGLITFVLWQSGIMACIGWTVARAREQTDFFPTAHLNLPRL